MFSLAFVACSVSIEALGIKNKVNTCSYNNKIYKNEGQSIEEEVVKKMNEDPRSILHFLKQPCHDAGMKLKCVQKKEYLFSRDILAYLAFLLI